jgi:hypothetical protein
VRLNVLQQIWYVSETFVDSMSLVVNVQTIFVEIVLSVGWVEISGKLAFA